jgi:hypothetical protein
MSEMVRTVEASEHDEVAGEYERLLDQFDNVNHTRPRVIEAGVKAFTLLKPFVHSDILLTKSKELPRRDVRMVS